LGCRLGKILIRGAKQLLTLRGSRTPRCGAGLNELGIIADGALLIVDGILREVGPSRRVENLAAARDAAEINAAGRVVMPGFIDCHTHLAFPPPDVADEHREVAARTLTADTGKRTAARWLAYLGAMARHGTTTVEIKTGAGPNEDAEKKMLRVLSILQDEPLDLVPTFLFRLPPREAMSQAAIEEYAKGLFGDLLPRIRKRNLAQFADLAWDAEPSHHSWFDRYLAAARAAGFGCKVHADGMYTAAAIAMAVRNLAVSIDHLERATPSEVSMLAGSPTMATLLPCASFHSGLGNAPARALVDAGVAIALGSNFNARHNPTLNMQTVVSLACLRLGLTPAEAISAATINGAHALGCAAKTGSLEPGKQADIAMLNVSDYHDLGSHFGANLVHATMKRGEVIYREGNIVAPRSRNKLTGTSLVLH
jgi:imidazolonepropionase